MDTDLVDINQSPMIRLYGIPNCDRVRKARAWLAAQGIEYRFHDYRKQGLDENQLRAWVDELGWEVLLNRRSASWRALDPQQCDRLDATAAIRLMLDNPTLIRRPLLDTGAVRHIGFSARDYEALLR